MKSLFAWAVVFLICASEGLAQNVGSISAPASKPKSVEVPVTLQVSTDLKGISSTEKVSKFLISPEINIPFVLDTQLSVQPYLLATDNGVQTETRILDTDLAISRSFQLTDATTLDPELNGSAPSDSARNKEESFNGALGVGSTLTQVIDSLPKKVILVGYLAASRNLYEFSRDRSGEPNVENEFVLRLIGTIKLTDKWDFTLDNQATTGVTYTDRTNTSYRLRQLVGVQLTKNWKLSLGHSNSRDILESNGTTTSVGIFEPRTSTLLANLRFIP